MSPLPELDQRHMTYGTALPLFIDKDPHMDSNRGWFVLPDRSKEAEFLKSTGVDLAKPPFERYDTHDEKGKLHFHNVYSTPEKDLYLELVFDDLDASYGNQKSILKSRKEIIFHKLGERVNEEYIASITNG